MGHDVQVRLKHLVRDRDRHGNVRHYYRPPAGAKVRLRAAAGTPEFLAEYNAAVAAASAPPEPPKTKRGKRLAEPPPKPGTFRWLCVQYLSSAEFTQLATSSRSTRRGIMESMWDEPIAPGAKERFADFPLDRLTAKAIRVLRDRKAHVPDAANGRLKVLRRLFAWGMKSDVDLVTQNFARDVDRLKPKRPGGFHAWTVEEVQQFRARHPIGTKARLAMELLLLTSQRRSDMVNLGRQHIRRGAFHLTQVKNGQRDPVALVLPIHPELAAAIELLPKDGLALLTTAFGKPFTANGFGNWFRERCDEADLPHCSAHGLRKASLTLLAEHGATDREIMAMSGHRTAKEVDRYTRSARQKRLAKRAMAKLLSPEIEEENEN